MDHWCGVFRHRHTQQEKPRIYGLLGANDLFNGFGDGMNNQLAAIAIYGLSCAALGWGLCAITIMATEPCLRAGPVVFTPNKTELVDL